MVEALEPLNEGLYASAPAGELPGGVLKTIGVLEPVDTSHAPAGAEQAGTANSAEGEPNTQPALEPAPHSAQSTSPEDTEEGDDRMSNHGVLDDPEAPEDKESKSDDDATAKTVVIEGTRKAVANERPDEPKNRRKPKENLLSDDAIMSTDGLKQYLHQIGKYRLLTARQEIDLAKRIERGDLDAKETMSNSNLKLVVDIAKAYKDVGMNFMDIIQEGNLGLLRAVEKFDYRQGFKFSTYATFWIRQAIHRALDNKGKSIPVPAKDATILREIGLAERELITKLKRQPNEEELLAYLGKNYFQKLTPKELHDLQAAPKVVTSTDKSVGDREDSATFGDLLVDENETDAHDEAQDNEAKRAIAIALIKMRETQGKGREAMALELRYGLNGKKPHTLAELSAVLEVTQENARLTVMRGEKILHQDEKFRAAFGITPRQMPSWRRS